MEAVGFILMPQAVLRPTSTISTGAGWTGTFPTAINDASDLTSVYNTNGNSDFFMHFADLPVEAALVTSPISCSMRYSRSNSSAATLTQFIYNGAYTYGTGHSGADTALSGETISPTTAPGGLAWTPARVNALQGGAVTASGISTEEAYVYDLWWTVTWEANQGGFAFLVGALAGAALGLAEMSELAAAVYRKTGSKIMSDEYREAWLDIKAYRHPSFCFLGRYA